CTRTCGAAPSQISAPHSLAFDSFGSLYVGEWGNHRVQKFELLNYPISYNQPKLCPNVNWSEHGITFVNSSTLSSSALGIFIDLNDTIYVSDYSINKILIWSNQSISLQQKSVVSLYQYTSLFVTLNGDIYFENGNKTGRVEKFTSNSIKSEFVANFSGNCRGLFVDIQNSLYCSINSEHRVAKVLLDNDHHTITIVAGTNSSGSKSYQLNGPWGIFIDINFNLYVADAHNNRIQFFRRGELNGTTVAGNKTPNNLVLEHPTDVILDGDGFLYVADNDHHRIIQVRKDEYQCISGCKMKSGLASNQLNKPYSLRFDSFGNLYVTDEFNHRIQKFDILNNSCEIISTTAALTTEIPTTILLTTELPTTHACKTPQHSYLLPSYFVAPSCEDSTNIGFYCDILGTLCDIQNQCVNNGKCININDNQDYNCSCSLDFSGKQCQFDQRVCKENTCLNKGVCKITSKSTFNCTCSPGFEGTRCERRINYCLNITCYNEGVCRSVSLGYICQCLSGTSGQHCEKTETKLFIYKAVSKSFAYIAIVAMVCVALFVLIMDILKYCFGIDLTRREVERIRRERRAKRRKPAIQRLVYVNITSLSDRHFRL
ncbi:unnamed protein product, partial [Adineta steineri]